nr:MAG TPA: hypothetical protein [Caudoviricetes sp.]
MRIIQSSYSHTLILSYSHTPISILYLAQYAKRVINLVHVVENKRMKRRAEALTLTQECHQ